MRRHKLSESGDRGWFIGQFDRAIHKTDACEVSYQINRQGDISEPHYHKIATEVTLVISGSVWVNGEIFCDGEMFVLEPGEVAEVEYLEDTASVVVKTPGPLNDKYLV